MRILSRHLKPIQLMRVLVLVRRFKMDMSTFLSRSDQQKGEWMLCWCHSISHLPSLIFAHVYSDCVILIFMIENLIKFTFIIREISNGFWCKIQFTKSFVNFFPHHTPHKRKFYNSISLEPPPSIFYYSLSYDFRDFQFLPIMTQWIYRHQSLILILSLSVDRELPCKEQYWKKFEYNC